MNATILVGDVLERLRELPDKSVDSIVTDPPYELGFMGKAWDSTGIAYSVPMWREALRVLKPGGHLLSFGGSRTYHRMACAIEDAGFEIRDQIMWIYGSGFPKSLDVSKAIDKAAGVARPVVGVNANGSGANLTKLNNHGAGDTGIGYMDGSGKVFDVTAAATDAAKQWSGWGTALKPAHEPICVARKPLIGTVAANVLAHGTGALNIDACRVEHVTINGGNLADNPHLRGTKLRSAPVATAFGREGDETALTSAAGRWPANVIHDGSEEVVSLFPQTSSGIGAVKRESASENGGNRGSALGAESCPAGTEMVSYGDSGSAARFFYTTKADRAERESGCYDVTPQKRDDSRQEGNPGGDNPRNRGVHERGNNHPTVKPVDLMRYLVRLVTPPGGVVLDTFMGSGSTGVAAMFEGMDFIGIDNKAEYAEIAEKRIREVAPMFNEVVVVPQSLVPTSLSPCAPEVRL